MKEAAVGGIQGAEAIFTRFDCEVREEFAVDEQGVAENFGGPGRLGIAGDGIVKLAFEIEDTVVEDQRNFVLAAGQVERIFNFIPDEKDTEEAGENIQPVNAQGMIVIPEHGGVLVVGIVIDRGLAGNVPVVRIAVALRGSFGSVQVNYGSYFGLVRFCAVDAVIDGKEMLGGEFVGPFDEDSLAASGFEGWAGRA